MQEVEQETNVDTASKTGRESGSEEAVVAPDLLISETPPQPDSSANSPATLKAVIEAAIYITDEPLTPEQIASAIQEPADRVKEILNQLVTEYAAPDRGLSIRELAGGYKMSTK